MNKENELKGMLIVSAITFIIMCISVLPLYWYIVDHGKDWEGYRIALNCIFPFFELWIWWKLMCKFVWKFKTT